MFDRAFAKVLLCTFAIVVLFTLFLPDRVKKETTDKRNNMAMEAIAAFRATLMFPIVSVIHIFILYIYFIFYLLVISKLVLCVESANTRKHF